MTRGQHRCGVMLLEVTVRRRPILYRGECIGLINATCIVLVLYSNILVERLYIFNIIDGL